MYMRACMRAYVRACVCACTVECRLSNFPSQKLGQRGRFGTNVKCPVSSEGPMRAKLQRCSLLFMTFLVCSSRERLWRKMKVNESMRHNSKYTLQCDNTLISSVGNIFNFDEPLCIKKIPPSRNGDTPETTPMHFIQAIQIFASYFRTTKINETCQMSFLLLLLLLLLGLNKVYLHS